MHRESTNENRYEETVSIVVNSKYVGYRAATADYGDSIVGNNRKTQYLYLCKYAITYYRIHLLLM